MSKITKFTGGTHRTIRENFYQRQRYKNFIDSADGKFLDSLYNPAHAHYGSLNYKSEPVMYLSDEKTMKEFSDLSPGVHVLNFVYDAFTNFRKEYSQLVNRSTINFPPFLGELRPTRGHEPFEEKYGNYFVFTTSPYVARMEDNEKIINFEDFIEQIKIIFLEELNLFPITKSGFSLSRFNPSSTTGLAIELASLEYDLDTSKGLICQSPSFECYINAANKHGFLVDAHAPWRLYADLKSPVIQYLIRRPESGEEVLNKTKDIVDLNFVSTSHEDFLDSVYRSKPHFDDLYHLQDFCYQVYNQIKKRVPFFSKMSYTGESEIIYRKDSNSLKSDQWLELLLYVRLIELGKYEKKEFSRLCQRLSVAQRIYGVKHGAAMIGQVCSKIISESYEKHNSADT